MSMLLIVFWHINNVITLHGACSYLMMSNYIMSIGGDAGAD